MRLSDTVELMNSNDYKKRFKAEYFQLLTRCESLEKMIDKYERGELEFEPTCPIELLQKQLDYMHEYLWILEERAFQEDINLFMINIKKKEVTEDLS